MPPARYRAGVEPGHALRFVDRPRRAPRLALGARPIAGDRPWYGDSRLAEYAIARSFRALDGDDEDVAGSAPST